MNSVHEQWLKQYTTQCAVSHYEKLIATENPLSRENNSIVRAVPCRVCAQCSVTRVVPYRDKIVARVVSVSYCDIDEFHRDMGSSYHD